MTRLRFAATGLGLLLLWPSVASAQLGTLIQDGPPTPEQVSMYMPVVGGLAAQMASVRWKPTAGSTWTVGHPLYRIHPEAVQAGIDNGDFALGTHMTMPVDAFAGVVTGLTPGVSYTMEVTTRLNSGGDNVQTLVTTTRDLPAAAGAQNKTIVAGSTEATIQTAFDALNPSDVILFQDGTYNISSGLTVNRSGSSGHPIYIRGTSRNGTILHMGTSDQIITFLNASDIVWENMTITGPGVDGGINAGSEAFRFNDNYVQNRVTIRNCTVSGVDVGVADDAESGGYMQQFLFYDNTMTGNDQWNLTFLTDPPTGLGHNVTWNDDGVREPGVANCTFNNTFAGFGDTFAVDNGMNSVAIHVYRNEVKFTCDDAYEEDFGTRNMTYYDNRIENSMTFVSFDPLFGGPSFVFRNVMINTGRSPYKLNNVNSGYFIYNNTLVRTTGISPTACPGCASGYDWGWNQSDNGDQTHFGYRNNILIWRGSTPGHLMAFESGVCNPIDWTNNAWFPDAAIWWTGSDGASFANLAEAKAGVGTTVPIFSTATKKHVNDVITISDPFASPVTLGADYSTKIVAAYSPALANGSTPKNAGVAIPGITDGYSGAAPDMGAIISGITPPIWGDRSGGVSDTVPPAPPTNLKPR